MPVHDAIPGLTRRVNFRQSIDLSRVCVVRSNWGRDRAARAHAADLVGAMVTELFAGRGAVHGAVSGVDFGCGAVGSAGRALGISLRDEGRPSADECRRGFALGGSEDDGNCVHRRIGIRDGVGGSRGELAGGGGESGTAKRHAEPAQFLLERGCSSLSVSGGSGCEERSDSVVPGSGRRVGAFW